MVKPVIIEPISDKYIEGLQQTVAQVARERRYLMSVRGFSLEQTREFVRAIQQGRGVQFIALHKGEVVGWCDICTQPFEGCSHVGVLGMGILDGFRGQGLGQRLLEESIRGAVELGISRIELQVFSSNTRAIRLYERCGFETEGIKRRARILDGKEDDLVCMALLL